MDPSEAFAIRRASAADASVLADHRVGMFRDMNRLDANVAPTLRDASERYFARAIPVGEYVAWIVHASDDTGSIIGGGGVQIRSMLPRVDGDGTRLLLGREGLVLNVYVERQWRRRGIARLIMQEIIAWAPTAGIVRLVLHASDEGRQLYESMGFVPTQELRYTGALAP